MKIEEIKELIHALEQSQLTCLEVSQGSERVRLEKNYTAAAPVIAPAALSRAGRSAENAAAISAAGHSSHLSSGWCILCSAVTGGCPLCDSGHTGEKRRCIVLGGSHETDERNYC